MRPVVRSHIPLRTCETSIYYTITSSQPTQHADHRHRRLLRARRQRPRSRRAAEQSDKIPSPHGLSLSEDRTLPRDPSFWTWRVVAKLIDGAPLSEPREMSSTL
jgi:hypothetical protein